MRNIETDTVTLPAYFASAFVNGDYSGLTDDEAKLADKLTGELSDDGWNIVDVVRDDDGDAKDPRFTWSYRLYGGDANGGEVLDYVIHRIPDADNEDGPVGNGEREEAANDAWATRMGFTD